MSTKHTFTPGPWEYDPETGHIYGADDYSHVDVQNIALSKKYYNNCRPGADGEYQHWSDMGASGSRDVPDEEQEANACLIAAAPDLLEALEELLQVVEYDDATAASIIKANAALSKAIPA